METLLRDLRFAVKTLVRRPLPSAAAILCLALGIGAATVVFSLIDTVVLRPLRYENAERIVMIWNRFPGYDVERSPASGKELLDYREQTRSFDEVAGFLFWYYNLTGVDEPERLVGGRVSANMFRLLGVEAGTGRVFVPEDEEREERLAVLSHAFWQRRYGGDPALVGQAVSLDDVPHTVVGILPAEVDYPLDSADVFLPWKPNLANSRTRRGAHVYGRLKEGVPLERARSDLAAIAERFQQDHPEAYPEDSGWGVDVVPLHEYLVGDVRPRLFLLFGAVALVLVIAGANVANLLLAQAASREREFALRMALGSGRRRLARQVLTESVVLAVGAGAVGLAFAAWGTQAVAALDLPGVPRLAEASVDLRVVAFTLGLALLVGLVFGSFPAWRVAREDLYDSLREGAKSSTASRRQSLLRHGLVVAEIALALVVLIGAGLTVRTLQRLQKVDPGFRTDDLVTLQLFLPIPKYPRPSDRVGFYHRLRERLEEIPEIETAGVVNHLPLGPLNQEGDIDVEGREVAPNAVNPAVAWRMVSPEYFEAMAIPVVKGRAFNELDTEESLPVVVVDSDLARRLWPDEDPIDKRLKLNSPFDQDWRTVVGVVGPVKQQSVAAGSEETLYVPYPQYAHPVLSLALHTAADPAAAARAVRAAVRDVDPGQPIAGVETGEDLLAGAVSGARFNRLLFGWFGALALALAGLGVYGVMAYSVARRTSEIGLRMALGARRGAVLGLVLRQGLVLTAAGVGLGVGAALVAQQVWNRKLADLLQGTSSVDAVTFVAVPLILAVLALGACLVPAWRATRVDPQAALRQE